MSSNDVISDFLSNAGVMVGWFASLMNHYTHHDFLRNLRGQCKLIRYDSSEDLTPSEYSLI